MAITDKNATLADAQTITATVAAGIVGDVYDTGSAPTTKDLGNGNRPIYLVISIDEAVDSNGAATVCFSLLSDSTATLVTSVTTHCTTGDIAKATLVTNKTYVFPLPNGDYERYLGLVCQTKVQTLNSGKVNAYLTLDPPKWVALPDGL